MSFVQGNNFTKALAFKKRKKEINMIDFIKRLVIAMIVLGITAFITPGMSVSGGIIATLFVAALAVAIIDYLLSVVLGLGGGPRGGIISFLVSALVFWLAGRVVSGFDVTVVGALIGALVYGLINGLIGRESKQL